MAQDDIQGQVVDAQGNPVDGAIVELTKSYQSSPTGQEAVQRTTTDSNGNYIFEGHPDGDGTTQEWHVSAYNHDGTAYVNSFNNPGVTADLPSNTIPDSAILQPVPGDLDHFTGDTGSYSINNNSPVSEGDYSMKVNDGAEIVSTSGLDAYFEQGQRAKCRVRWDSSGTFHNTYVLFGAVDVDNYYFVRVRHDGSPTLRLGVTENGSATPLNDASVSVSTNTFYEFVITRHSDDLIECDLTEVGSESAIGSVSGTDGTYSSETGIGMRANSPQNHVFDYYRVTEGGF